MPENIIVSFWRKTWAGARELSESCVSHNSGTRSGVWGRSPQLRGSGGVTPENFWNLRCDLVYSGAFSASNGQISSVHFRDQNWHNGGFVRSFPFAVNMLSRINFTIMDTDQTHFPLNYRLYATLISSFYNYNNNMYTVASVLFWNRGRLIRNFSMLKLRNNITKQTLYTIQSTDSV